MSRIDAGMLDAAWVDAPDLLPTSLIERIRKRAAEADAAGRLSVESLAELRTSGFLSAPIPLEMHGGGLGLAAVCALQRRLATADPALAIALNMHIFSVGMLIEQWHRAKDNTWLLLEAIATQDRLLASGFAEPGLGGSILRSTLEVQRVADGYRVTGRKQPCSLAQQADLVCLQFEDQTAGRLMVALIPTTADGIRALPSWDAMGMRGSASDTLLLEDCWVPDDLIFHNCEPGYDDDPVFAASLVWFSLSAASVYLGLLERALCVSGELLRRGGLRRGGPSRASVPAYQQAVGDIVARAILLAMSCTGTAQRYAAGQTADEVLPLALAVKTEVAEFVVAAVGQLCELVGGMSYGRGGELARLWRDAQAARFHPPSALACRRVAGARFLGMPYRYDLSDTAGDVR